MPSSPKILAFAGSNREGSYNQKLLKIAVSGAEAAGAAVTVINFRDYPLPIYDAELEAANGLPENALELQDMMLRHDGFLIASPENNSSISALLKNVIDWTSRPSRGRANLECYRGKVAAIMSASTGALGGLRGLVHVRAILENIHVLVIPSQKAIPKAHEAFLPDGSLKDEKMKEAVEKIGAEIANLIAKLKV